ncbi:MAG: sensor histidine kinase [Lachnospiraceae bacterium]
MKRTLYPKLLLGYLLFCVISFIIVTTFTTTRTHTYLKSQSAQSLYKEANLVASDYAVSYYNNDITLADFEERIEALALYLNAQIWVVSQYGEILVNSSEKTDLMDLETIDGFDISDFGNRYYAEGTFYNYFDQDQLTVYSPISINYKIRGYIFIHKSEASILSYSNGLAFISYQTLCLVAVSALILLVILLLTIVLPINKILRVANEYTSGNFEPDLDISTSDEIGFLAASLSYMANELNTLEDDQKKFISNVSHDFRSPLTSIKGYVEAIADGTIPPENQEKYLNIILFETERLNKLTNSLLELNKYGHRGIMLDMINFDINQMIRMTVLTFEGTCVEKHIGVELLLAEKTLYVHADMSKIQRVVYNLTDNAIKFSSVNSQITIETTKKNGKVFISVKDHGIGIPKDSLNKIWERFYKTDLSRGKDKRGTGLGLSIVKEIIQAHNELINVVSTEGIGTEFIFSLAATDQE